MCNYWGHCLHPSQRRDFQRGVIGGGSQPTGELAGNFYCFLWRGTTSSSSVCAVSQVCCSRPQSSLLKHMRQTALGNSHQPLKNFTQTQWLLVFRSDCVQGGISHISQLVLLLSLNCTDAFKLLIRLNYYLEKVNSRVLSCQRAILFVALIYAPCKY